MLIGEYVEARYHDIWILRMSKNGLGEFEFKVSYEWRKRGRRHNGHQRCLSPLV